MRRNKEVAVKHAPEILLLIALVLTCVLVIARLYSKLAKKITVWEYEQGLLYTDGKLTKSLPPGAHWICPLMQSVVKVDMRERQLVVAGQELLSLDNVGLKLSIAGNYKVVDPKLATNKVDNYYSALYIALQLELREIISTLKIEELLEKRNQIGERLLEVCRPKAAELGLELVSANVKDIMFAGDFKKIFGQIVKAQKEGQAALERARGETAALRSLANAAKMLETNPMLLQLRAIQAMSETNGNSLIFNVGQDMQALPLKKSSSGATSTATETQNLL